MANVGFAATCSVDICDSQVTEKGARGLCPRHYQYWLRTGVPVRLCPTCGGPNEGFKKFCSEACKPRCSVEGCDSPVRKRGWCASHYAQQQRTGRPPEPFAYKWGSDSVTYNAVHERLRTQRGPTRRHACAHGCGRAARQWAYDHTDPAERLSDGHGVYSVDLDRYVPLCCSCHKVFDLANPSAVRARAGGG